MKPTPSAHRVAQAYSGNPDGKPIYPNKIDHGYEKPIAGGSDVMQNLVQDLRHEQGSRRASAARVAARVAARIPKPVLDFADVIKETLLNAGVAGRVKPFNSGYIGITIDLPQGKFLYLDQPGVVGLEDQSPGYISFGHHPQGKDLVHYRHKVTRGFGDVRITDAERRDAQQDVLLALENIIGV
jgi:hypothetical protein